MHLVAELWQLLVGGLTLLLAVFTAGHVVLNKRDSRAAVAWVGLILLAPIVGAVLYMLFGVNRIRRRAAEYRAFRRTTSGIFELPSGLDRHAPLPGEVQHLGSLARLVGQLAGRSLLEGNAVTPLLNGDEAYPVMLDAIARAETSVALSTYIFDNDGAGHLFMDALEAAAARGVAVRVLVDAVGARYSWPPIIRALARRGVRVARFGRTLLPWRMPYMNLRNHRKLLIVDGRLGFTDRKSVV